MILVQKVFAVDMGGGKSSCCTYQDVAPTLACTHGGGAQRMPDKDNFNAVMDEQPILLESNQNHATVQTGGISTTLPASMGNGGGYTPMITEPTFMSDRKGHNGITTDGTATTVTAQEKERPIVGTSVVRRLTPLEGERLQGFPDNWSKYGDFNGKVKELSDAARYRLQGNSIARPFWTWLLRRIAAQYERPATLGSLFDGQSGFPLCAMEAGIKPVWSSEIEPNVVAVAKYHFPEDEDDTDFIREYGWMEDEE